MTRVPSRVKTATIDLAHVLNGADPYVTVKQADVLRKALYEMYLREWNALPEETRDILDREELERAVDEIPDLEEVDFSEIDVTEMRVNT